MLGLDSKGYTVSDLAPLAIVFVVLTVTVGMGALILAEMNETVTDSSATTVLEDGLNAVQDFSGWFSILVIVVIAAVIIGIVLRYFSGLGGKAGRQV